MAIRHTWLDSVLATPIIGCNFKTRFLTPAEFMQSLRPLFQEWDSGGVVITVQAATINDVAVETARGLVVRYQPNDILVEYR